MTHTDRLKVQNDILTLEKRLNGLSNRLPESLLSFAMDVLDRAFDATMPEEKMYDRIYGFRRGQ